MRMGSNLGVRGQRRQLRDGGVGGIAAGEGDDEGQGLAVQAFAAEGQPGADIGEIAGFVARLDEAGGARQGDADEAFHLGQDDHRRGVGVGRFKHLQEQLGEGDGIAFFLRPEAQQVRECALPGQRLNGMQAGHEVLGLLEVVGRVRPIARQPGQATGRRDEFAEAAAGVGHVPPRRADAQSEDRAGKREVHDVGIEHRLPGLPGAAEASRDSPLWRQRVAVARAARQAWHGVGGGAGRGRYGARLGGLGVGLQQQLQAGEAEGVGHESGSATDAEGALDGGQFALDSEQGADAGRTEVLQSGGVDADVVMAVAEGLPDGAMEVLCPGGVETPLKAQHRAISLYLCFNLH